MEQERRNILSIYKKRIIAFARFLEIHDATDNFLREVNKPDIFEWARPAVIAGYGMSNPIMRYITWDSTIEGGQYWSNLYDEWNRFKRENNL